MYLHPHEHAGGWGERMIIIVLLFGALVFFGVIMFFIFGGLIKVEHDQKKAEADADRILDATFDGRSDVTFTPHMRTLKYETVILGAKERGYKLTHQAGNQYSTLVFEKTDRA